jgi:hypothetical protein
MRSSVHSPLAAFVLTLAVATPAAATPIVHAGFGPARRAGRRGPPLRALGANVPGDHVTEIPARIGVALR